MAASDEPCFVVFVYVDVPFLVVTTLLRVTFLSLLAPEAAPLRVLEGEGVGDADGTERLFEALPLVALLLIDDVSSVGTGVGALALLSVPVVVFVVSVVLFSVDPETSLLVPVAVLFVVLSLLVSLVVPSVEVSPAVLLVSLVTVFVV